MKNKKQNGFLKRKIRTRIKVRGQTERPRLSVYKSNKYMSAQIIDDTRAITLVSVTEKALGKLGELGKDGVGKAKELGKIIAEKALKLKIKKVVFDKGGYAYHGKIKAIADGAREGGLEL
ncbi:MAG: 50S ribosomal protein L18 [Patescibacteria group bacterium]